LNYDSNPSDPVARRDEHLRQKRTFANETAEGRQRIQEEIDQLVALRYQTRMRAADTAGLLGLRYLAETNSYVHLIPAEEDLVLLPETVPPPVPIPREAGAVTKEKPLPQPRKATQVSRWMKGFDILLWAFLPIVGAFVGLGLASLAGLPWRNDAAIQLLAVVMGISVVGGLKILIATVWRHVGHLQALGRPIWWPAIAAVLITVGGCILDATLGARALHTYMTMREWSGTTVPDFLQLFLLALAITTPLLLGAGALSYMKGLREPNEEEKDAARYERELAAYEAEVARIASERRRVEEEHHAALARHSHELHQKECQASQDKFNTLSAIRDQNLAEWEELKSEPNFKCLQGLISQIDVLSMEIEVREQKLKSYNISRGYQQSAEFKNGVSHSAPVEVPPSEPESGQGYVS